MVDSSITDEQRRSFRRRLTGGFVLLVGLSAGLVAIQARASPLEVGAAIGIGLVLGGGLAWYLVRLGRQYRRRA
jgi:ammonia channel protein AmtB